MQRYRNDTEARLASIWAVVATTLIVAIAAAAVATAAPSHETVRHGVVVGQASLAQALLFAAIGAVVGIGSVLAVVVLWSALSYETRGDPTWAVRWTLREVKDRSMTSRNNGVELVCKLNPPVDIAALFPVEAVTRLPTGEHRHVDQHSMASSRQGIGFPPLASSHGEWPRGEYEIRWYALTPRRAQYEVARSRFTFK